MFLKKLFVITAYSHVKVASNNYPRNYEPQIVYVPYFFPLYFPYYPCNGNPSITQPQGTTVKPPPPYRPTTKAPEDSFDIRIRT